MRFEGSARERRLLSRLVTTALLLYAQAEVGYYLLMDAGERDLQTALDLSIAGQARAREAIAEQSRTV